MKEDAGREKMTGSNERRKRVAHSLIYGLVTWREPAENNDFHGDPGNAKQHLKLGTGGSFPRVLLKTPQPELESRI